MILTATCSRPLFQFAVMPLTYANNIFSHQTNNSFTSASEQCRFSCNSTSTFSAIAADSCSHCSEWDFFCKHAAILLPELTPSYLRPNSLCTLRTRVQLQGGKCDGRIFVNKCNGHSFYWTQSLVLLCPSCKRMCMEVKFTAGESFDTGCYITRNVPL